MASVLLDALTQSLTFFPLALGISISYTVLRATDMTLDGSFVLGAAIFAKLITLGYPPLFAFLSAIVAGMLAGVMVSLIQYGGKVDSLLAGILATFILVSLNLLIMQRPNINLLSQVTLVSAAFDKSELMGWSVVAAFVVGMSFFIYYLLTSRLGLILRALGDNPHYLKQLQKPIELYRISGFALTNALSAIAGALTAQTVGYADIGMGTGMTLTGIGAILLGQHVVKFFIKTAALRIIFEITACYVGVYIYYFAMNGLLRLHVNPLYLKMILGFILILFLRTALNSTAKRNFA